MPWSRVYKTAVPSVARVEQMQGSRVKSGGIGAHIMKSLVGSIQIWAFMLRKRVVTGVQ